MKKGLLFLLPLLVIAGCSGGNSKPAHKAGNTARVATSGVITLGPKEAAALLKARPDMVLLDVRTPEELKEGSIERAILTPYWSLVQGTMNLPKNKPVMLVGAIGGRCSAAAQILARNGYREVYTIRGGMIAWKDAGLPLKYYSPAPGGYQPSAP